MLHSVVETKSFIADAADAGMSDDERAAVVDMLAADPETGDIMKGCGGARKVRVKKPGGGKSGGYRVITYYGGGDIPLFLITVFGKNEKVSLTKSEQNELSDLCKILKSNYKK
ncbi:type II toxin-antitoxin system RelE/ParE family toxin [Sphingomonas sp. IC081]|uniref:type II toxin-antitoxin system RelE/ParE family toxin n=1 Tax=Sphingomonas sp. IC081 TaxID=304378 RepID=UPI001159071E|nr:type II toxin-antitoxin system RelE/ParE family toxin [Sphingomonas sp. IC081]QDK32695.1 addiction module toxin RelE [Sphingomonas sp. IC081]